MVLRDHLSALKDKKQYLEKKVRDNRPLHSFSGLIDEDLEGHVEATESGYTGGRTTVP